MLMMTPRAATRQNQALQTEFPVIEKGEGVSGMMAMNILKKAGHAQIIILAIIASDHI